MGSARWRRALCCEHEFAEVLHHIAEAARAVGARKKCVPPCVVLQLVTATQEVYGKGGLLAYLADSSSRAKQLTCRTQLHGSKSCPMAALHLCWGCRKSAQTQGIHSSSSSSSRNSSSPQWDHIQVALTTTITTSTYQLFQFKVTSAWKSVHVAS